MMRLAHSIPLSVYLFSAAALLTTACIDDAEVDTPGTDENGYSEISGGDNLGSDEFADSPGEDQDVRALNPSCYGAPRETPLSFLDPQGGFLSDREAQAQLLKCLGQSRALIGYRLQLLQKGERTEITYEIDVRREADGIRHSGQIVQNGQRIAFSLDETTAGISKSDGDMQEVPSGGANTLLEVEELDPLGRMSLGHSAYSVGLGGLVTGLRFELLGKTEPWTFQNEGDSLRARVTDFELKKLGTGIVAKKVDLLLTSGAVPREAELHFVGRDFESEFTLRIR